MIKEGKNLRFVALDKETPTIIAKSGNPYNKDQQLEIRRTYMDKNDELQRTRQGINVHWDVTLDLLNAVLEFYNSFEGTDLVIADGLQSEDISE